MVQKMADRLAEMQTFVTVVESGSFSKAAKQLGVGQPAVSKTVANLEDRLGVKLLLRSSRGLSTTEAGGNFYSRVRGIIEDANDAETSARGEGASLAGRLRIGAAPTFASQHVIPFLPDFLAGHPDLDMEIVLDDWPIDLIEEGIDVSLRMGALSDSTLTVRKIGEARRLVVGTPSYFNQNRVPHGPADLCEHECIIHAKGAGRDVWLFRSSNAELSVTVKGKLRVSAAEGVRSAVRAGLGLTIASEWMFSEELASGEVITVLEGWELDPIDLWAVFPSGRTPNAKARRFIDFVEATLSNR